MFTFRITDHGARGCPEKSNALAVNLPADPVTQRAVCTAINNRDCGPSGAGIEPPGWPEVEGWLTFCVWLP